MRRVGAAVVLAAGFLVARGVSAQAPDLGQIERAADAAARAQIAAGVAPGMTVAVARNGEVVFARGYGVADVEKGVAAGADTAYRIGSVTKQFTAALVLRLAEAGRVRLDAPVSEYLPDYPVDQGRRVTVRHLLNHTSGIRDFGLDDRDEDGGRRFGRDLSYREIVDRYGRQPLEFEPGTRFAYCNTGYYLLGEIISRVTGKPYAPYVERELLKPLGLSRTFCEPGDRRRPIPGLAGAYAARRAAGDAGSFARAPYVSPTAVGAAGALCSTAGDLARWTHLLHAGKVVSPALLRQMTTPAPLPGGGTTGYGLGLFVGELEGRRRVYHGGAAPGALALVAYYPDDGLTVVVLMNGGADRQKRDAVERAVARAALGIPVRDLPLTAADRDRYAGTYAVASGGKRFDLRVFAEGDRLKAQVGRGEATRLRYQGGHAFFQGEEGDDVRLVFSVGEDGRARAVAVDLRGQTLHGERTSP